MNEDIEISRDDAVDLDEVVALGARSLGWPGDATDLAFLRWKHRDNPAGASPMWTARTEGRLVAIRTLLRWRLRSPDGARLDVVRAVDTATDPDFRGRGLFQRLTLAALDELRASGVHAVFNTPNDQSRPGYLKMGWSSLGRPTLALMPSGVTSAIRLAGARVAAEKWSEPLDIGRTVDSDVAGELAKSSPVARGIATELTAEHLAWRFGHEPLHYRAIEVRGGHAVVRLRRRGPIRELAIVGWCSPRPDRPAIRRLLRATRADVAVAIGLGPRHGFVPIPRQGPILTWRPLAEPTVPTLGELGFSLGDLELL